MKKLSKEQIKERDALLAKLAKKQSEITSSIGAVEDQVNELNLRIGEYNDIVGEANDFREQVAGDIQDFIDDHSEKWPETENGERTIEWHSEWDNASLDELEPADFSYGEDYEEAAQTLEDLPEEPQ